MSVTDDLLYNELGVDRQASANTIKHAFRRLALKHHPDKDPQGTEKFKNINEAFQVLNDPNKRKKYDAQGYQAVLRRDPASRTASEDDGAGETQTAKDDFDEFLEGLDEDVAEVMESSKCFLHCLKRQGVVLRTSRKVAKVQKGCKALDHLVWDEPGHCSEV